MAVVPFAAHYLKQQHTKAKHVRLDREDAIGRILGCHITATLHCKTGSISNQLKYYIIDESLPIKDVNIM